MSSDILKSPGGTEYRRAVVRANAAANSERPDMTAQPAWSDPKREKRLEALQWAQLIGIIIAVASIFMAIGKRDQVITDLKDIVTRLVEYNLKTQADLSSLRADVENLKARRQ